MLWISFCKLEVVVNVPACPCWWDLTRKSTVCPLLGSMHPVSRALKFHLETARRHILQAQLTRVSEKKPRNDHTELQCWSDPRPLWYSHRQILGKIQVKFLHYRLTGIFVETVRFYAVFVHHSLDDWLDRRGGSVLQFLLFHAILVGQKTCDNLAAECLMVLMGN